MTTTKKSKAVKSAKSGIATRVTRASNNAKGQKPTHGAKTTPAREPRALTSEEVATVLELGKGSHSIELKLFVPAKGHSATIKGLKLDPVEAQPRQAFFFDTPSLDLYKAGIVVRARRIQGGRADTVIKLRPVDPAGIDARLQRSASLKIEVDVMMGGFVCSASLKGACTGQEVLDTAAGDASLSSLFSKEQRDFFDAHAPAGITLDSLAILGPTFLLRSKYQPKSFNRPITVEMWLYPDGSRILEISTKSLPEEAFQVAAEFKNYLARRGISSGASQGTKTKTALEYFSSRLASEAPATLQATADS